MKYKLKTLSDIITSYKEELDKEKERIEQKKIERTKQMERNRSLLADLDAIGLPVSTWFGDTLEYMEVDIGTFNTETGKKASEAEKARFIKTLKELRELIGGPLTQKSKEIYSAKRKLIKITLKNDTFPGVSFYYITKLPKNAKCKIVRQSYRSSISSLVCEV